MPCWLVTSLSGVLMVSLTVIVLAAPPTDLLSVSTVAGTGQPQLNAMHGKATEVNVGQPFGVEIGPDGALYVTEVQNHRVLRVDLKTGELTTVAGCGRKGYSGDGGPATAAELNEPYEVRFDRHGHMYFVEMQNHVVRRVDARTGVITTIAGTGQAGFSGDDGPAVKAQLRQPHSIALHGGSLYIADIGNHRIRRVDLASGIIETVAGTGERKLPTDGQPARGKPILGPRALYVQGDTLWIALREGNSVWRMDLPPGTLHHVAGTGAKGYSADGTAARQATFYGPKGVAVSPQGEVFVVDTENQAIRYIDADGARVYTAVGGGPAHRGFAGAGPLARRGEVHFARPHGICLGPDGALYIGDSENHRVRRVAPESSSSMRTWAELLRAGE
jgi:streptogramin lyase